MPAATSASVSNLGVRDRIVPKALRHDAIRVYVM